MKKIHIFFFVIAIFVLPISIGTAYGAQECDEVKVRITGEKPQDALKRVATQMRLHWKDIEKEGQMYEGQLDISCLVGLYMTIGVESETDALDRYMALEEIVSKQFGEDDQMAMRAVWEYKLLPFVTDSMKREYFEESGFFLLALANMSREIVSVKKIEGFPYRIIQDHAFCRAAIREREKLDKHRIDIEQISATDDKWAVLSKEEFNNNRKNWTENLELVEVCGADQIVTSALVKEVENTYRQKANQLTSTYWKQFLADGSVSGRAFEKLEWLEPSCPRPPYPWEEKNVKDAILVAKDLIGSKWWQPKQVGLYDEATKLVSDLATIGEPRCRDSIGGTSADIGAGIKTSLEEFRYHIGKAIDRYWRELKDGSRDRAIEQRLEENRIFAAKVSGRFEQCVVPNRKLRELIQAERKIRQSKPLPQKAVALSQIPQSQQVLGELALECRGEPKYFAEEISKRIESHKREIKERYKPVIRKSWVTFNETESYESAWLDFGVFSEFCDKCWPTPKDRDVIVSLKRDNQDIDRDVIQHFYNRLGEISLGAPSRFLRIRTHADLYIKRWDRDVVDYWNELLTYCRPPDTGLSRAYTSTNQYCSVPDKNQLKPNLLNYCRLKKLSEFIPADLMPNRIGDSTNTKIVGGACIGSDYKGSECPGKWEASTLDITHKGKEKKDSDGTDPADSADSGDQDTKKKKKKKDKEQVNEKREMNKQPGEEALAQDDESVETPEDSEDSTDSSNQDTKKKKKKKKKKKNDPETPEESEDSETGSGGKTTKETKIEYEADLKCVCQQGGTGADSGNTAGASQQAPQLKDSQLIELFDPRQLSDEVRKAGFERATEYKNSYKSLTEGTLENIYQSRLSNCNGDVNEFSIRDIGKVRDQYRGLFNKILIDLTQADDARDDDLSRLIINIMDYLGSEGSVAIGNVPEAQPPVTTTTATFFVDIRSNPKGANVYIDDVHEGTTPLIMPLGGRTTIRVEKEGYGAATKEVNITKDRTITFELEEME